MIRIEDGDCLEIIPRLADEGVVVDAVVTDPPYHLQARVSRFSKEGSAPPKHGRDGAMGRISRGFMGQEWDGGDIAFRPETWAVLGSILRPGGIMLVFGGSRTYHRMACAIEDAGFVVQDSLLWLYGTGFPKRRDQLKPAYEQICFAYKPGGARTVQIDECRVATNDKLGGGRTSSDWAGPAHKGWRRPLHDNPQKMAVRADISKARVQIAETQGRWPANVIHDNSNEVVELFPANRPGCKSSSNVDCESIYLPEKYNKQGPIYDDDGSVARFFWSPKANKADRAGSDHPTIKPVALTEWLVRLVTPPDGTVLDAFAGSGVTGQAAAQSGRNAILIERQPQYVADIYRRLGMPFDL